MSSREELRGLLSLRSRGLGYTTFTRLFLMLVSLGKDCAMVRPSAASSVRRLSRVAVCLPALLLLAALFGALKVNLVYAAGIDLTVDQIWLERATQAGLPVTDLAVGESFNIVASIRNVGSETAHGYYIDVYHDGDYGRGGPDDIASAEVQVWYVGPLTATAGTHTTRWVVDPDNAIAETNDGNNEKQYTFTFGATTTTTTQTSTGNPTTSSSTSSPSTATTATEIVTVTSTSRSTSYVYQTSYAATVTSYASTYTSTQAAVVTTTVTQLPTETTTVTMTSTSTSYVYQTTTATVTSYSSTQTVMQPVVVTTTVAEVPTMAVTVTSASSSTEYITSTLTTTATSYTSTTTVTSTNLAHITVTATGRDSPMPAGQGGLEPSTILSVVGSLAALGVFPRNERSRKGGDRGHEDKE